MYMRLPFGESLAKHPEKRDQNPTKKRYSAAL